MKAVAVYSFLFAVLNAWIASVKAASDADLNVSAIISTLAWGVGTACWIAHYARSEKP